MPPPESSRWFSDHVQPHEEALRAYLLKRFPSVADHDDLVQEAYSRLVRDRDEARPAPAKAWLFAVARNLAFDWLRRRRRNPADHVVDIDALPNTENSADVLELAEREQRREVLHAALNALPPRCREVMLLRYGEGLRYKEIASRLEISPDTVRNHMIKGVRACTAFARERGLLEASGAGAGERDP